MIPLHRQYLYGFMLVLLSSYSLQELTSVQSTSATGLDTTRPEESADNESHITSPSTSSLPQVTTTIIPPSSTTETPNAAILRAADACHCNLSPKICDINCCCDDDCTEEQSRAFSGCADLAPAEPDLRYCTKRDIFFANRTLFEKRPVGDLFCIFVDNAAKEDVYENPPNVSSVEDVHELIRDQTYGWQVTSLTSHKLPIVRFKVGDSLFLFKEDGSKLEWRLPVQLFTSACEATEAVTYLQNQEFECMRQISSTKNECSTNSYLRGTTYHHGFSVLAKEGVYVPIKPLVCNKTCVDFNSSFHLPYYSNGRCHMAVRAVSYKIVHDGIRGIHNVTAEYEMDSIEDDAVSFKQSFSTVYSWYNEAEEGVYGVYSGRPGYIVGLPILAECFESDNVNCESNTQTRLTAPAPEDGLCSPSSRRFPLKFGINVRTGCLLSVASLTTCATLQRAVLHSLLGDDANLTHVAMTGNANRSQPEDWTAMLEEQKPDPKLVDFDEEDNSCHLGATGIDVHVLFARTESGTDPQNKIIGILYRYVNPKAVAILKPALLELSFSATFNDVSRPRVTMFAPPPTIDVRLPYDFFYPFFLESSAMCCSRMCAILFLFALLMHILL
ncbi:tectonic-3-like [Ornithodoros turicata]|uniref:tectonic-3-like n=1 Tax=Ornithodoros turicata TaxID=34597 RepID=UPI00313A17AD